VNHRGIPYSWLLIYYLRLSFSRHRSLPATAADSMSAPIPSVSPVGPDTLITVKVLVDGQNRRFKLALRDLGAHVLPQKVSLLPAQPCHPETETLQHTIALLTWSSCDSCYKFLPIARSSSIVSLTRLDPMSFSTATTRLSINNCIAQPRLNLSFGSEPQSSTRGELRKLVR